MSKNTQILVKKITTVANVGREDVGRYVEITTLSDIIGQNSIGVSATFFDRDGHTVSGTIVNMRERVQEGKFPHTEGLVVDTKAHVEDEPRKRMQQGGIVRLQPRVKSTPPNKRTQP